jgi:hypothetical protein
MNSNLIPVSMTSGKGSGLVIGLICVIGLLVAVSKKQQAKQATPS